MKERINQLWEMLALQRSVEMGYVKILVDSSIHIPVFLAMIYPDRNKALLISVHGKPSNLPEPFIGKGIKLEQLSSKGNQVDIMLTLTDSSFSHVFDIFLEDCLNTISTGRNSEECLIIFNERFISWREMLEVYSENGLHPSTQQGLFGEMIVLMRLLKEFPDSVLEIITAWQGPDKFGQDFQYNDWGIEVKTTTGADSVQIANETQLHSAGLNHLFLWHMVLDKYKDQGVTLNNVVSELNFLTSNIKKANTLLNIRLATIGYHAHQSYLYDNTGYFIRQESVYSIVAGFPALTPNNVPFGVNSVKYNLNLSVCTPFIISEKNIYLAIKF